MFTMKSEYALRIALVLAKNCDRYLSMSEILEGVKGSVPREFAEKILNILKRAGIVKTQRGRQGGYALSKPPGEIRVSEIVFLLDRKSRVFYEFPDCPEELDCVIRSLWKRVEESIEKTLDSTTLADMLREQEKRMRRKCV